MLLHNNNLPDNINNNPVYTYIFCTFAGAQVNLFPNIQPLFRVFYPMAAEGTMNKLCSLFTNHVQNTFNSLAIIVSKTYFDGVVGLQQYEPKLLLETDRIMNYLPLELIWIGGAQFNDDKILTLENEFLQNAMQNYQNAQRILHNRLQERPHITIHDLLIDMPDDEHWTFEYLKSTMAYVLNQSNMLSQVNVDLDEVMQVMLDLIYASFKTLANAPFVINTIIQEK